MRRLFIFLSCSSILFSVVFAHPGRTDSNGGHWDRSTGEYHFHTGEYAGRGSSGSSSNYSYDYFEPPYDPPTENPYKQKNIVEELKQKRLLEERKKDESLSRKFITACSCYLVFFFFYLWCSDSTLFKG